MAIAGFVLALLGFVPIIGGFFALLGLIFGIIGLVKSGGGGTRKGLSIAAIILAVVAMVVSIVVTVALVRVASDKVKAVTDAQNIAAPVTGKLGQPVKDGDFTFVVTSVRCGLTTSGGLTPSTPQGEFCAVGLSVSNHGTDSQGFVPAHVEGFIAGSKYPSDEDATKMANPPQRSLVSNIRPGDSIKAIVLIDVPVGKKLDTVELHDSLISDGTSVSVK